MGRGMIVRQWYAQLDSYDTIRRMMALLSRWSRPAPTLERLFICDFFLANPALLHETHMPGSIRETFRSFQIARPATEFLSYPAAPVLFAKMEGVQREALQTLLGKGLLDFDLFRKGRVALQESYTEEFVLPHLTDRENLAADFITAYFATIGENEPGALRQSTGLRRARA
jgi:hypothetical protein